ncbi:uncharacterized protein LODBEIA_P34890 [Lodderomyces beijingensis]|uniref:SP-RING-type domain-containing protein n=1 Tax=Lodderomyces beijingensis TaxID=1775926 RepID=A0ABP0ZM85_9ASCO
MSQSAADEPVDQYLPIKLSLPAYVPLKPASRRQIESIFNSSANDDIKQALNHQREITKKYLKHILSRDDLDVDETTLHNFLRGYKSLYRSHLAQDTFANLSRHPELVDALDVSSPELCLANLDEHHVANKSNFIDIIRQNTIMPDDAAVDQALRKDEFYVLIKNIAFVIRNPEEAIPDEGDDDLSMAGVKVNLKDPMTMNFFVVPKMSTICHHTYEESSILQHLGTGKRQCPVVTCTSPLDQTSLKDDMLMRFRIRIVKKMERGANRDLDLVE